MWPPGVAPELNYATQTINNLRQATYGIKKAFILSMNHNRKRLFDQQVKRPINSASFSSTQSSTVLITSVNKSIIAEPGQ